MPKIIEGPHETRAGQQFGRRQARAALLVDPFGERIPVAGGAGIGDVHDQRFGSERLAIIPADLFDRRIGHDQKDNVAKRDGLGHRSRPSVGAGGGDQILELLGMA